MVGQLVSIFRHDSIQKEKRVIPSTASHLGRKLPFPETPSRLPVTRAGLTGPALNQVTGMGSVWSVKTNQDLLTELRHVKDVIFEQTRLCQEGMNEYLISVVPLSPLHTLPIPYGSILSPFCHRKPSLVFLFQVPLALSLFLSTKCWLECPVILCSRCINVHLCLQLLWLFSKGRACCYTLPYHLVKVTTFLSLKLREEH